MTGRVPKKRIANRSAKEDALAALAGAQYHLSHMRELAEVRGLKTQGQVNRYHWHLRAFFWELYAVSDVLYGERKRLPILRRVYSRLLKEAWFEEIKAFRDHAHYSSHMLELVRAPAGGKLVTVALTHPDKHRRRVLRASFPHYLTRMAAVVKSAFQ
jgi:hypothetical protein